MYCNCSALVLQMYWEDEESGTGEWWVGTITADKLHGAPHAQVGCSCGLQLWAAVDT